MQRRCNKTVRLTLLAGKLRISVINHSFCSVFVLLYGLCIGYMDSLTADVKYSSQGPGIHGAKGAMVDLYGANTDLCSPKFWDITPLLWTTVKQSDYNFVLLLNYLITLRCAVCSIIFDRLCSPWWRRYKLTNRVTHNQSLVLLEHTYCFALQYFYCPHCMPKITRN